MLRIITQVTLTLIALSTCLASSAHGQTLVNLRVQRVLWIEATDNLVAFTFRVITDDGPTPQATNVISVYDAAANEIRELGPRVECASGFVTGSTVVAYILQESNPGDSDDPDPDPPHIDLNGDGDTVDNVLHVYASNSREVRNLRLVAARPECGAEDPTQEIRIAGDLVAFRAVEFLNGTAGVDFNRDGDTNDSVLHIHDTATGVTANLDLAIADGYHWSDETLAFAVSEFNQGESLNDDGDLNDAVLHLYDGSTGTVENLGRAVFSWRLSGRLIAYTEEIDRNGDGFLDARVLSVRDIDSGVVVRPEENVGAFEFLGDIAAFSVNEQVENRDLDGDGVIQDVSILHVLDLGSGLVINLERVVPVVGSRFGDDLLVSEGGFIAFRFREADQPAAVADLNGDGDVTDEVVQVYDARTGVLSAALPAESGLRIDHARVAFSVAEIAQNHGGLPGTDLNGDGDIQDRVVHVFDVATGTFRNLGLAVDINTPGLALTGDKFLTFLVSESSEQENLNFTPDGDLDTTDFVLHTWDAESLIVTNIGLEAQGPPLPVASKSVLGFVVSELSQQDDLNGDMDRDDPEMIHVADFFPPNADGDLEGDGVDDPIDNCPDVVNSRQNDRDGDGAGDACDADDDDDGVADTADNCPRNPNADQENTDGDGAGNVCDLDDDNDGLNDGQDNCPLVANANQDDLDGDGTGDACDPDRDGDGVPNGEDNCPLLDNSRQEDQDGDGIGDDCDLFNDSDLDGIADEEDNCPVDANPDQADADGDGHGDVCDLCALGAECGQGPIFPGGGRVNASLADHDVFLDVEQGALNEPTEISITALGRLGPVELTSSLGDAIAAFDLEPSGLVFQIPAELAIFVFDFQVLDSLHFEQLAETGLYRLRDDGLYEPVPGAFCDPSESVFCEAQIEHLSRYAIVVPLDTDGDTVFDDYGGVMDNCPLDPNEDQADGDGDGIGDACDAAGDPDGDGDGIPDTEDNCPLEANPAQEDLDSDGEGNACDADDDGDGHDDGVDNCPLDANADQANLDGDAEGDVCDADDDGDGHDDAVDNCPAVANAMQSDADNDGLGDVCDACHADPTDTCDPDGSVAGEVPPAGGTVVTGNGRLRLDFDDGDLPRLETISVTSGAGRPVPLANSLGRALAIFDLQPDGLVFANPVALTITWDVSALSPRQRGHLDIYTLAEAVFEPLGALCQVLEDPVGVFAAVCTAELQHFSEYALVTPLDSDGDGVFDQFGSETDNCPDLANTDQADFDGDSLGDPCDDDADGDGVSNAADRCPETVLDTVVDPQSGCPLEEICEEIRGRHPWWTWFFEKPRRHGFGHFGRWKWMRDLNVSDETRALCRELAFQRLKARLEKLKERLEQKQPHRHDDEHRSHGKSWKKKRKSRR